MYQFYSECIAMSSNAVSFKVEIAFRDQVIGKGNVIVNKKSICDARYDIRMTEKFFGRKFSEKDSDDLIKEMSEHCCKRAKFIFDTN